VSGDSEASRVRDASTIQSGQAIQSEQSQTSNGINGVDHETDKEARVEGTVANHDDKGIELQPIQQV